MFKIIKKTPAVWQHELNGQIIHLSSFGVVADISLQTFILRALNGSYFPQQSVGIADIILIDETDASVEETFGTINELLNRLVVLNYTPYIDANGISMNLQQVTDNGQITTNPIVVQDIDGKNTYYSFGLQHTSDDDLNVQSLDFETPTTTEIILIPNESGTMATREWVVSEAIDQLDQLHDVNITSVANNQILAYTSASSLWENKSVSTALGFTPENVANKATNLTSPDNTKYPTTLAVSEAFDPLIKRRYFDDLQGYGSGGVGSIFAGTGTLETEGNIWLNRNGVGTTWARTPAEAGHSGIIRGGTGTTSSGLNLIQFRSIWIGTEDFICQTAVRIQNLSDATNRFTIGFSNGVGTVNSMRIFYSDNINGGKWRCETYSGSLSTLVDSGILVAANTWYDLKISRINMICYFYINNVLVATSSTNIPSNFEAFCGTTISKIVGTTSRTCDFDYLKFFDL
jgi:hypothetical protein